MKTLLTSALVAVALSMLPSALTAATAPTLPKPCSLLKRAEAQTLAGIKVQPGVSAGTSCAYTAYPTGPVAQVFIYVESTFPNTILVDRKLGHKFWKVKGLGDQALGEQGYIFVRKGKIWVTLNVLATEVWGPAVQRRLEQAAKIAISRVKSPKRKAAALTSTTKQPPAVGGRERWTGKQRKFGGTVTEYAGVTYQPSVVLIGGGAKAVRGRSPDGLTWTIAANAPGAADLRVGKIMLATTFAAGRVLKLTRVGPNLRVMLGPAALTDIIRDGTFESPKPVRVATPLVYQTKLPAKPKKRRLQAGAAAFATTPVCCAGGIGVKLGYDNGSTGRLSASVRLYAEQPSVDFHLEISGGRLIEAAFELTGVGGLRYDVRGATMDSSGNVKSGPLTVPGSLTIPLAGPLSLTLTQSFQVSMQLGGQATLIAYGDYPIKGKLAFGYTNGAKTAEKIGVSAAQPLQKNTLSLGVGVNAISLGWKVRATVGIGLGVFSAGVWYALSPGIAIVADGSHLMSLKFGCVTSALAVNQGFGIGFTMAEFVTSIVNAFLGAVGAQPIPETLGKSWGPYLVVNTNPVKYCPPRDQKDPPARTVASSAAKDPKALVLQKEDFLPASAQQRKGFREKGPGFSSYFAEYRTKATGAKAAGARPLDVLTWAHVMSPAMAAATFRELRSELKGEPEINLPNCCGSKDQIAVLAREDNEGQLLARKGGVIWGLSVNTAGVGNWGLITMPEAIAALKRFGSKQMKRVG